MIRLAGGPLYAIRKRPHPGGLSSPRKYKRLQFFLLNCRKILYTLLLSVLTHVSAMARELFTIGYQGATIDTFIANLIANNIDCVLDVRALPLSRKPGFSKTELARRLNLAEIQYVHFAELGTPKTVRENLKTTHDYSTFFRTMETYLAKQKDSIETAYNYIIKHKCCLMCFERFAAECHRKIVAAKIKERDGNGLKIKDI